MTERREKLRAKYRGRFLKTARDRVSRGLSLLVGGAANASKLEDSFRVIAGEASMLGLDGLATVAWAGEDAARLWREQSSEAAGRLCRRSLDTIADTLDVLGDMNTGDFAKQASTVVSHLGDGVEPVAADSD